MVEKYLMLRLSLFFVFLCLNVNAIDVLLTKESIGFEEEIKLSKLRLGKVKVLKKYCVPLTLKDLEENKYVAKHYINKKVILCKRDIKLYKKSAVVFDFGSIQIEKKGKIIFENEKFIRIKKEDGKIEKIYKDGNKKWKHFPF